ncbi:MAG: lipocalin-like domain-containing protein [Bacteroidaceae bacterium]|nr:lipocalin-like domain-containing protein [Bacteroidaceae bacterium]
MGTYKVHYFLPFILCLMVFLACDRKTDENGDLDGMWQLTEWRDRSTGHVLKTNEDNIYYCVQLKLIKFQVGGVGSSYYLSHFTHTPEALTIGKTVYWPDDEERPLSELAPYGVPSDGRFRIDALTGSRMQLSTDQDILVFRKY